MALGLWLIVTGLQPRPEVLVSTSEVRVYRIPLPPTAGDYRLIVRTATEKLTTTMPFESQLMSPAELAAVTAQGNLRTESIKETVLAEGLRPDNRSARIDVVLYHAISILAPHEAEDTLPGVMRFVAVVRSPTQERKGGTFDVSKVPGMSFRRPRSHQLKWDGDSLLLEEIRSSEGDGTTLVRTQLVLQRVEK